MEPKSEMIHIRVSPRYKRYVEQLAENEGCSISGYINRLIRDKTQIRIVKLAESKALAEAIRELNFPELKIPQKLKSYICTPDDIKDILNKDDFKKLSKTWAELMKGKILEIAAEFDFSTDLQSDDYLE
jgi:predicted HicB family RNase H-like nuclease